MKKASTIPRVTKRHPHCLSERIESSVAAAAAETPPSDTDNKSGDEEDVDSDSAAGSAANYKPEKICGKVC